MVILRDFLSHNPCIYLQNNLMPTIKNNNKIFMPLHGHESEGEEMLTAMGL